MTRPAWPSRHDLLGWFAAGAAMLAAPVAGQCQSPGAPPAAASAAAPAASSAASSAAAPAASSAPGAGVHAPAARVVAGVYRGTFGADTIEMTLTQDKDAQDSVHGWYIVLGTANPQRVLLAGEWEDDTLSLEESRNGVDVSGNWSAIFNADGFAGQWSDINGEHLTDIALHRLKDAVTKKKS